MNRIAPTPVSTISTSSPAALAPASTGASTGYVLASAAEANPQAIGLMFSPFPTYSSPFQSSPAQSPTVQSTPSPSPSVYASLPPELATASAELPAEALAYAAPGADDRAEMAMPAVRPESANAAPTPVKRAIQPPHPVSSGPTSASNAVLNNAQIGSIRERLKLTSYQTQLWPPVESALRDIIWQGRADGSHKTAANPRGATIDPNSVPVQRLKSAAFPLIISLSEDQKQEVRTMVRLMGLENLASQF